MTAKNNGSTTTFLKRLENWIAAHPLLFLLLVIAFLCFLFLITWAAHPAAAPPWTGFGEVKTAGGEGVRTPRTLWDWLEILLIPAFLAGGAAWIARSQQNRELEHSKVDREIAEQTRETDREIAKDKQDQLALENYYDHMADLLLNHGLRSITGEKNEERTVASARTLALLRSLNITRKDLVIRYLYESDLIAALDPVIILHGADLSGAHLFAAHLEQANLNKANLSGADLRTAALDHAYMLEINLSDADLFEASLRRAKLISANLNRANLKFAVLREADLMGAHLIDANWHSARMRKANLREADLSNADLSHASLSHARLIKANLTNSLLDDADLFNADLSGADLSGASLRGALLKEANLTQAYLKAADLNLADLSGAIYSIRTIWPDGFDPIAAGAILVEDDTDSIVETDEEE